MHLKTASITAAIILQCAIVDSLILEQINCSKIKVQQICPNSNVTFWLYTSTTNNYRLDPKNNSTIKNAPFIPNTKTVVLFHGYNGSKSVEINEKVRPNYLAKGYNVISVDYSPLVPEPCYLQAVKSADRVSKCFVQFFRKLLSLSNVKLSNVHVVGFSLGGQIAGRVGDYLREKNLTIPRVTGLDVAAPLFYGTYSYISPSSAAFVDAIHTNVALYGKALPVGHIDFYVNDVVLQSACADLNIEGYILCSHLRGADYFGESINTTKYFCGRFPFKPNIVMGEYTPIGSTGRYHVDTNKYPPYAKDTTC